MHQESDANHGGPAWPRFIMSAPPELMDQIRNEAERRGLTMAGLMRVGVIDYLKKERKAA